MPEEIFFDHIVDTRKKSLSKMRKPELYEYTKDLFKENAKLLKENANLKFLNSVGDNIENVERIEFLEKEINKIYIKLKEKNNKFEEENNKLKKENNNLKLYISTIRNDLKKIK